MTGTVDLARPRPWLLLPIETKVRELHGKALLAALAAEAGYGVVLGDQNALLRHLPRLPRGLYIDKSAAPTKAHHFARLRQAGYRVAAWCEEGLVYLDAAHYVQERVGRESIRRLDRFLAWGPRQARDIAAGRPEAAERLAVVGNPRIDVLRPELRPLHAGACERIRAAHGRFLLINTNFARFNHYQGEFHAVRLQEQRGQVPDEAARQRLWRWCRHMQALCLAFEAMLPRLAAAFPDRRIVVRPHPSENHDRWRERAAGLANVEVVHEGSAAPWILASEAVIHAGCSTGLEAALLGVPAVSYRPVRDAAYDARLPHAVSRNCSDFAALVEALRRPEPCGLDGMLADDIAALDGPLAVDRILQALEDLPLPALPYRDSRLGRAGARAVDVAVAARRRLRERFVPSAIAAGYLAQKFPGLHAAEVVDLLVLFQQALGRATRVAVRPAPGLRNVMLLAAADA